MKAKFEVQIIIGKRPLTTQTKIHWTYLYPGLTNNQVLRKIMKNENIIYAHKPHNTLSKIFTRTKDKIEKEQQSNVVYEIKCKGKYNESCNKCYIGTTKRALGIRISEHKADERNKKMTTALAQHLTANEHTADFANTRILDVERGERRRITLESLRIQQNLDSAMNFKDDVDKTNNAYTAVIKRKH